MTNKERVLTSLNHKQSDKVPYNIDFTHYAYQKMAEYLGDPDFEAKLNNCFAFLSIRKKVGWKEVKPDIWEDEFGVQWDRSYDASLSGRV